APHLLTEDSHRLVFVNGRHRPDLSDLTGLPQGVELTGLADLLKEQPSEVEPYLGRIGEPDGMALLALNTAFMQDGAVLRLARGAVLER
ncbi:MAG: Fe-S cluster assembly protein SufD, partial [Gammaproteobacteria bacterium]|nr:Fe-S cluster assembly protein SufD [Gammaproteobacteria bacterium]